MTYINFEDFLSEILSYRVINLSWGLSNATSIQKFLIFFFEIFSLTNRRRNIETGDFPIQAGSNKLQFKLYIRIYRIWNECKLGFNSDKRIQAWTLPSDHDYHI